MIEFIEGVVLIFFWRNQNSYEKFVEECPKDVNQKYENVIKVENFLK